MKISIFPFLIIISTQVTKRFDKNLTVVDQFMVRENLIEKKNNKESQRETDWANFMRRSEKTSFSQTR